jgi:hypothetical protein
MNTADSLHLWHLISRTLLVVSVLLVLGACATSAPLLSDAERCSRFGGSWAYGTCRAGAP